MTEQAMDEGDRRQQDTTEQEMEAVWMEENDEKRKQDRKDMKQESDAARDKDGQEEDKLMAEMQIGMFLFKAERGMSTHEDVEAVKQALRLFGVTV
jgi:hypothetical protein